MALARALAAGAVLALLASGCSSSSGTSGQASPSAEASSSPAASASAGPPLNLTVAHPTVWLCRPGMADNPCEGGLDATVIADDGKQSVEPFQPAKDPKIDCFYVYPTLSQAKSVNAPLAPEPAAVAVARTQASRFASICRLFVPVYRQLTLSALVGGTYGNAKAQALANLDVDSAWHDYLDHDNDGRGVVLIGHSQGAGQVSRLIRSEIDNNPVERSRIVSVLAIGGNVLVPQGKDVGGSFAHIPACHSTTQTGCVVAYSSFNQQPPKDSLFGRATSGSLNTGVSTTGMQVLCVNPAALAGGVGKLEPYEPTRTIGSHLPFTRVAQLPVFSTGFITFGGLTAQCRESDGASWLQVTATNKSADDVDATTQVLGPTWGLHLLDISNAEGNLVNLVGAEAAAWR
jgi:Protein of unknown function (DUF3089)